MASARPVGGGIGDLICTLLLLATLENLTSLNLSRQIEEQITNRGEVLVFGRLDIYGNTQSEQCSSQLAYALVYFSGLLKLK